MVNISSTHNNDINLLNDGGLSLRDGGRTYNYDIFLVILRPCTTNYEHNYVIIEPLTLIDGGQYIISS